MNTLPTFSYFYHPSPFERDIVFKDSLFDYTYKIKYETGWIGKSI